LIVLCRPKTDPIYQLPIVTAGQPPNVDSDSNDNNSNANSTSPCWIIHGRRFQMLRGTGHLQIWSGVDTNIHAPSRKEVFVGYVHLCIPYFNDI